MLAELDTATGQPHWLTAGPRSHCYCATASSSAPRRTPALPFGLTLSDVERSPAPIGIEQLQPGDLVVLCSDGVVEARSPDGGFFGEDRLVDLIVHNLAAGLPAPETLRRLIRALLDHQQGKLTDDATLLVLQCRGEQVSDAHSLQLAPR